MFRREIGYTVMLLLLICNAAALWAATPPTDGLRTSILALDSAWTRSLSDLQQKKNAGSLLEGEKRDYAKFITFLSTKINEYCHQLRSRGGEQAVADLPCPDGTALVPGREISLTPTKADQVAELDKSLSEALGEFDEQLLKEEQKIASRLPAERESGSGYGAPGSGGGSGRPGSGPFAGGGQPGSGAYGGGGISGSGGQAGTGTQGTAGTTGSGSQPGTAGTSGSGATGSGQGTQSSAGGAGAGSGQGSSTRQQNGGMQEIESGYDDIVARQLREAAEKETDPELRAKLWEEYRKYKEGIR